MAEIHLGFLEKAVRGGAMAAAKVMFKKETADMRKNIKDIPDPVERQKQMENLEVAKKLMDFKFMYPEISSRPYRLLRKCPESDVVTVTRICQNWANGLLHEDVSETFCLMFFDGDYLTIREKLDTETMDILRKAENAFLTKEYVAQWYENFRNNKY